MDPTEIAEDCNTRCILPVKGEDTGCLLAQTRRPIRRWYMALVLLIVRGRYLRQQARNHLDNVSDRHSADLIFLAEHPPVVQGVRRSVARPCEDLFACETLYVAEIADLYAAW